MSKNIDWSHITLHRPPEFENANPVTINGKKIQDYIRKTQAIEENDPLNINNVDFGRISPVREDWAFIDSHLHNLEGNIFIHISTVKKLVWYQEELLSRIAGHFKYNTEDFSGAFWYEFDKNQKGHFVKKILTIEEFQKNKEELRKLYLEKARDLFLSDSLLSSNYELLEYLFTTSEVLELRSIREEREREREKREKELERLEAQKKGEEAKKAIVEIYLDGYERSSDIESISGHVQLSKYVGIYWVKFKNWPVNYPYYDHRVEFKLKTH